MRGWGVWLRALTRWPWDGQCDGEAGKVCQGCAGSRVGAPIWAGRSVIDTQVGRPTPNSAPPVYFHSHPQRRGMEVGPPFVTGPPAVQ